MTKRFFGTYGNSFGQRQRLLRQDKSWKQVELAEELQKYGVTISNAWLSEIEKSTAKIPSVEVVIALAKALDTTTDFLLLLTDEPARPGEEIIHHASEESDTAGAIIDGLPPDWRAIALEEVRRVEAEWRDIQRQDREIEELLRKVEATGGGVARAILERYINTGLDALRRHRGGKRMVNQPGGESA